MAAQRASEGRFNEALTEFDDLRRMFAEAGDVVQSASDPIPFQVVSFARGGAPWRFSPHLSVTGLENSASSIFVLCSTFVMVMVKL
jgi:hypothetical protein